MHVRRHLGVRPVEWSGAVLVVLVTSSALWAQNSQLIANDDAGGALPGSINSLELYDNGLHWTVYGGNCSAEFHTLASLAVLGFRNPPLPQERYLARGCDPLAIGGAVRDETFVYYTTPVGVLRKAAGAHLADPGQRIGPLWGGLTPGAMMLWNGWVYYAWSASAPLGTWGYFGIERFAAPGLAGESESVRVIADGTTHGNLGRIKKLAVVERRVQGQTGLVPYGLALTDLGYLLRFGLEPAFPVPPAGMVLSGVNDFAVRREQFPGQNPFELFYEQDAVYAAMTSGLCPSDAAGRLVTVDPLTGGTSTVYTSADGYLSAVGLDENYLFVSSYARQSGGGIFGCSLAGTGVIRSKLWPASLFGFGGGGTDPNWNAIEVEGAGENLRSDGQWLYFSRGREVRRLRSNSPAIRHDFAALGLEAVQVIQNLNNTIRLVEGKRTIARAYARVADTTLSATEWRPTAQLRGYLDGVELPHSPIAPIGSPRITSEANYAVLRADGTRSYQFDLPQEWVRRGRLTLQFTVNPNLATYESGSNPKANNSVQAIDLQVVQVRNPCLTLAAVHSTTAPSYWPWENAGDFARVLERAKSMLPVADLHIHPTTERVSDEVICLRTCEVLGVPLPCGLVCNEPFDLSTKGGWSEALHELACYDSFDQNRAGCGRTHYVGTVHPAVMDPAWGGLARRPGRHALSLMTSGPNAGFNSAYGGVILAHELAHNLGRAHVDQTRTSVAGGCGSDAPANPDGAYPYDGCSFALVLQSDPATFYGFDVVNMAPIVPNTGGDLMSYANTTWPSDWTYNALLDALGPLGPVRQDLEQPPPGPYLLVRGLIHLVDGRVRLRTFYRVEEGVVSSDRLLESFLAASKPQGHDYVIRKLGQGGTLLEEVPLVIHTYEDGDPVDGAFHQFITLPDGLTSVQIARGDRLLAERTASQNAPVVSGVSVKVDPTAQSLRIDLDAADPDNDPLRFTVQFSNDGGLSWRIVRANEGDYTLWVEPRYLPGGPSCQVRVLASDGFHTTTAVSEAFSLPEAAPEVFLSGVAEGGKIDYGSENQLLAFALDAEDGSVAGHDIIWELSGPVSRQAIGARLPLRNLAPGHYTATASATDASGSTGFAQREFVVLPLTVPEGSAPLMDGEINDAAYATALTIAGLASATTRWVHADGTLYVAFSDLAYRGSGPQAAQAGIRVDVNAAAEDTAQPDDVAFLVTEEGITFQQVGTGSGMQVKNPPAPGFRAVITRGESGWNAELSISDSLLGGWDHAVRFMVEHRFLAEEDPVLSHWPPGARDQAPSTWAEAWFGNTPPESENLPPVAVASAPGYIELAEDAPVALNGSASYDPDGGQLRYSWTQVEGPPVVLHDSEASDPFFVYADREEAILRFELVVHDGLTHSKPAGVEIRVRAVPQQSLPLDPPALRQPDGTVETRLRWPGDPGERVLVQASDNLVDWETLATRTVGPLLQVVYADAQTGLRSQRYYRLSHDSSRNESELGYALQFDGVDDSVLVPHDATLNALPLTVSFWLRTTSTEYLATGLVSKYTDASANGWSLLLSDGRLRAWYFRDLNNRVFPTALGLDGGFVADGQWHHVAFVVQDSGGTLYVDGADRGSAPWLGIPGPCTTTAPVQFGRYDHYPIALHGNLDAVSIWNRAAGPFAILDLYGAAPGGDEPNLIGLWSFDEGAGTTARDGTNQGHDGTLLNGVHWVPTEAR